MDTPIILLQQSSCAATATFSRRQASKVGPRFISQLKYDRFSVPKRNISRLPDFSDGFHIRRNKNNGVIHASVPPEASTPVDPSPAHCGIVGLLGTIVAILGSFSQGKWGSLLKLKEKAETTIDELEEISDVVEEVAERVDDVAEAAAKHLPDGRLQDAAEFIEELAERIDENVHLAGDVLEKVDSFLDSTTHQEKTVVSGEAREDQK